MNLQLTDTIKIPAVGFGTYLISNEQVASCVEEALKAGYRHIDTAEAYRNEGGVGLALNAALNNTGLSRDDLFVTTKLWPGNEAWGQPPKTYTTATECLNNSLSRLQLDYVDLYLIHAAFPKTNRLEQWRALVDLREQGKIKSIGVSNFNEAHIEEIKNAGLPIPDANQLELHPWSQKPKLVSYLADNNILPIAYSSLIPLSEWRAVAGQDSAKTETMKRDGASDASPFKRLATKYDVAEAQILLRWALQEGYAILPKSVNPSRIQQNFDLFSFEIDQADMQAINALDRGDGVAWASGDPLYTD